MQSCGHFGEVRTKIELQPDPRTKPGRRLVVGQADVDGGVLLGGF